MRRMSVKPTTAADIPALQTVLDGTGLFPSDLLPEMMEPYLNGQSEAFWLSCHYKEVAVGFAYTRPEELTQGTWNMLALAVVPELQGQGYGAALVAGVEDHLRQMGERMIIVETSGAHAYSSARRFYASLGYEEEARDPRFLEQGR
ncbi:GNAT family N-acetyltransferase [Roseovarius phycicola]|uniref:GNAT family N-acetyltransferase n=1 Tax=Roseovarius phycicola TaxID=3080976 RepID=A0ABZ2HIC5_9RHOB